MSSITGTSTLRIKAMPFRQALLYFGLPALLFRFSLYNGIPALIHWGLSPFEANTVAITAPAAVLFALAWGLYKRDGYPISWGNIKTRFRLLPMNGKDWLWAIGGFLLTFLSIGMASLTASIIIKALPAIAPPDFFSPWLKPGVLLSADVIASFIGAPLPGQWGIAILLFIQLFFNISGEELWWRGYILPRQELSHGRWAWLIHGLLWLLWHVTFYPWQVIALLPICLALPYIAQRRQNTWVAIIIHLQNGILQLIVLGMVLGWA